jgi:diadenosine tetraphosphate (Ap4A) HIT family hydrolase
VLPRTEIADDAVTFALRHWSTDSQLRLGPRLTVTVFCENRPMTGQDVECVICAAGTPTDVIADTVRCWVTAPTRAPLPGYVCVVSKTHAVEPFDLAPEQQAAFWLDVCSMARAVRDAVASSKINDEIHGNTIPHLHLHVFPRYHPDDPFIGKPIDGSSMAFHGSRNELHELAVAIETALEGSPVD